MGVVNNAVPNPEIEEAIIVDITSFILFLFYANYEFFRLFLKPSNIVQNIQL